MAEVESTKDESAIPAVTRIVASREQAHEAATALYAQAKAILEIGRKARLSCELQDDDRSLQQNRYYWGVVLAEIAEQACINGQRWSAEAWHELGKRMFLGYEIKKITVAGRRRKQVIRRLRSTARLKVKPMSVYLEKVQAFACTDLGVRFSCPNWQEYTG